MARYRLSVVAVQKARQPGIYPDGGGLNLIVADDGRKKRWELRLTMGGRRRQLGLGVYPEISLEAARREAEAIRERASTGLQLRDAAPRVPEIEPSITTLRQAFKLFWVDKQKTLNNARVIQSWPNIFEQHVFPTIGDLDVATITTRQVADAIRPLWHDKPETAQKARERLRQVFDWALACEYREAANPALSVKVILGPQKQAKVHHPALPYARAPELVQKLRAWRGHDSTKLGLEFLLLTATRSSETRLATRNEVDLDHATWTIPAARMKMHRDHTVPLSGRCLEILAECKRLWPDQPLIFKGHAPARPLSENAFGNALVKLGYRRDETVAHGLRSTFRDWSAEVARARHEVAEACLAHAIPNAVVAAYLRTDFFEERRALMTAWAASCCGA